MRVYSEQFKQFRIKVIKIRTKRNSPLQLLFTVDRGVRVYERNLEYIEEDTYGMNYNGNYIVMNIKL